MEAPDGTDARNNPLSVVTSTSTVGFPRESIISRAKTFLIYYDKMIQMLESAATMRMQRRHRAVHKALTDNDVADLLAATDGVTKPNPEHKHISVKKIQTISKSCGGVQPVEAVPSSTAATTDRWYSIPSFREKTK